MTGRGHSTPAGEHQLEEVCVPPASGIITLSTMGRTFFSSATLLACSKVGHQDYFTVGNFATNAVLVVVIIEKKQQFMHYNWLPYSAYILIA